jgi:hypothetical protein
MNRRATDVLAAAIRRAFEPELALLRAWLLKQANPPFVVSLDEPPRVLGPSASPAPRGQDPRAKKAAAQRKWREKKRGGRPPSKGFPPPVDPERLRKAREIYARGGSSRDIRRETGLGAGTVKQYREAEGWSRAAGVAEPGKGRRRADPPDVVAEARRLYEVEWLGVKAIAQRLKLSSAGKVQAWLFADGWRRQPKPKSPEMDPPPSELPATSAAKPVDSVGVAAPVQNAPAANRADRKLPPPADPAPARVVPPAFVGRAPALRRVADYLFDQLRVEGVGQAAAANRVARLPDEELLDQANHRRARRRLSLFGIDGSLVLEPGEQPPVAPTEGPAAASPVRKDAAAAPRPPAVPTRPRGAPMRGLTEAQEADLRAGWPDAARTRRDVATAVGMTEAEVIAHAQRLGLGAKAQGPAASQPREALPPDTAALEAVPASLDTAQDWLIEDLVRADKVKQGEAEDRAVAMPAKRLFAEVNRRRVALGLSPYFLSERAA